MEPRFILGRVVATPGALEALERAGASAGDYLVRHLEGDWGEVDEHDWQANEAALVYGTRLLSAYTLEGGAKLWIISESDRSVTTLLLAEEY